MTDQKLAKMMDSIDLYAKAYAKIHHPGVKVAASDLDIAQTEYLEVYEKLRKFLSKRPTVYSFAIGDTVRFKPPLAKQATRFVGAHNRLTVTDVKFNSVVGVLLYGLNGSRPEFRHTELLLVTRATSRSVGKAHYLVLGHGVQNDSN